MERSGIVEYVTKKVAHAAVMKLVDIGVSKSPAGNGVRVRVPPAAPLQNRESAIVLSYIVGVALGDGNLSRPNGRATRLRISCDSTYPHIAEEIMKALRFLLPLNRVSKVKPRGGCFDISVYSNKLNDWMPWTVGMGPKKAQKARVPSWIRNDVTYSQNCLRGLIQTDGCIYVDRGYTMVNFTNNCKELAGDVHTMLERLGYRPRLMISNNAGLIKYTTRVARVSEVARLIRDIGLYKA